MKKLILWIILALSLLSIFPAAAQQNTSVDAASFVPAGFAGFIRLHIGDNADDALRGLNAATFAAGLLAPNRVQPTSTSLTYDDFFPLSTIFDTSTVTFTKNILPWVDQDMILAYRRFDGGFKTDPKDVLMILPTKDVFGAAGQMSAVVKAQDLPKTELYRGINIYIGDTSAFAVTQQAVFIGSTETVKNVLDIQAGQSDRLIDAPLYSPIQNALPQNALLSGFIRGDYILPALNGLLNGQTNSEPILAAFGEALSQMRQKPGFETSLLNGGFDAAGASVTFDLRGGAINASVVLHSANTQTPIISASTFDDSLLNFLPRNAMLVHSGTNAVGFMDDVVAALPLSNYARELFSDWPIQTIGSLNPLTPAPTASEIQSAASSYLAVLNQFSHFNMQKDLLDHLSGNYVIALIPRPNNPVPVLNTPFDVLIAAQTDDAKAAQQGVSTLLQALFDLKAQPVAPVDGWNFTGVGDGTDAVFHVGTQGKTLLITTGDADQDALRAFGGDNRLTDQPDWQALSKDSRPDFYLDVLSFYNVFLPSAVGSSGTASQSYHLGAYLRDVGNGLTEVDLHFMLADASA